MKEMKRRDRKENASESWMQLRIWARVFKSNVKFFLLIAVKKKVQCHCSSHADIYSMGLEFSLNRGRAYKCLFLSFNPSVRRFIVYEYVCMLVRVYILWVFVWCFCRMCVQRVCVGGWWCFLCLFIRLGKCTVWWNDKANYNHPQNGNGFVTINDASNDRY